MKKQGILVPIFFVILVLVAAGAYWRGRRDVWIWEYKVYQANLLILTEWHTNEPPILEEFIKGRYYYLANKIPKNWLGTPYDYGSVSTNVAFLGVGKGDTSAGNEYRIFKERGVPLRPAHSDRPSSTK